MFYHGEKKLKKVRKFSKIKAKHLKNRQKLVDLGKIKSSIQ